jgi:putative membrane protein insertion efficiency factor
MEFAKKLLIIIIKFYQKYISPLKGKGSCRFYPVCSEYAIQAITKYGIFKGLLLSIIRICKCHPFHSGGFDPLK